MALLTEKNVFVRFDDKIESMRALRVSKWLNVRESEYSWRVCRLGWKAFCLANILVLECKWGNSCPVLDDLGTTSSVLKRGPWGWT